MWRLEKWFAELRAHFKSFCIYKTLTFIRRIFIFFGNEERIFWQNSLFYNTFPIILFYNYSRLSAIRIISLTKRVTIIVRICLCIPKKIAWKIHIHANINESFFFSFFFISLLTFLQLTFFFLPFRSAF